jgi:hypothetical protein
MLDSRRFQSARSLGAPQHLVASLRRGRPLAGQPALVLPEDDPTLAARKPRAPAVFVRTGHARACSDAQALVHAKALVRRRASASFAQSPNASSLVAQAPPAAVLVVRLCCAMPWAPVVTYAAMASSGPGPASAPHLLRVTALGAPRRPESSFLRAATWILRTSKEVTWVPTEQIWARRSPHAVLLPASQTLTARSPFGLSKPVGLFAAPASKLPRVLLPQSQSPQRASAVLKVRVSVALRTQQPPARAQRRCEPVRLRQIAGASECYLGPWLRRRRFPGWGWRCLRGSHWLLG